MAKRGRGRPKWLPPDSDKVESLAARGLTMEQIAHTMGISYQTLNERSKEYTDFAEAIKRGKSKGISVIANSLFEGAKSGNTTAQIFFLKARAKWYEHEILSDDKDDTERRLRNADNQYAK